MQRAMQNKGSACNNCKQSHVSYSYEDWDLIDNNVQQTISQPAQIFVVNASQYIDQRQTIYSIPPENMANASGRDDQKSKSRPNESPTNLPRSFVACTRSSYSRRLAKM